MGLNQLALDPSLQSLTHALGLDDDSVEELIANKTSEGGHGCLARTLSSSRPASFVSSIESYQRPAGCCRQTSSTSRSPYMSSNISDQEASEVDLRHLACLDYCQITGSSTCSSSHAVDRSDNFSTRSSSCSLHRNPTRRSQSVYVGPAKLSPEKRSICSFLSLSSKGLPFSSRLRKRRETSDDTEKATWPQLASDVQDNPGFAAINAGLSGTPFADMTLVCVADGWETHVHSSMISSVCPMFLEKIQINDTINLDVQTHRQSSDSSSIQTGQLKNSKCRRVNPLGWLRGAKGTTKPPFEEYRLESEGCNNSIATRSSLSLNFMPKSLDKMNSSRPRKIQVTGCNGPDLRAFFFYLYTGQFKLVPSHEIGEVDESNAFRGHFKGSFSSSASACDETAWDPTRVRKSQSLRSVFSPVVGKEDGLCNRRLSSHTILSQQSTLHGPLASSTSVCSFAAPHPHNILSQDNASQAPPFSVQGAYHLSQVFKLSRLAFVSSSFFLQQLTLTNALQHYISPFAMAYPSIQSACLDYLVKHWSAVSAKSQSQTILGRLAAGWYPQANMALYQLLGKVE